MSSEGRVWAVATAHFDYVRPGDRLHVDPSDPYVIRNRLFESGFLVLEAPDAADDAADDADAAEQPAEDEPEQEDVEPEREPAPPAETEPSSE